MSAGRVDEVVRVEAVGGHGDRLGHEMAGLVDVVDVGQTLANAPQTQGEGADQHEAERRPGPAPGSAVGIDRVVAAGVDAFEAAQRHLIAGVVADVDDRLDEDGFAERVDGDAPSADPALEAMGALARVGGGLAAGDDVALAGAVEDPARVGDQLVVGEREQRAAPQLSFDGGAVQGRDESLVEVLVVGERGAQAPQAERRRRGRPRRRARAAPRRPSTRVAGRSRARASTSPRPRRRRRRAPRRPRRSCSGRRPKRRRRPRR